ncbi:MAG: class IV adenylate cyclase [Patescibacteria group bacterium]|nr:class IV adenylate cyclase [Patescibacteria group bacterium]MDD5715785.1 class IV adenylate cyclase [Patescibacteria group bacterium]
MPKEIEIQVRLATADSLIKALEAGGKFRFERQQIDEYYTPPHRDFTSVRPVKEWLRLRDAEGVYSLNYKNWHYDTDGTSNYCDEYETQLLGIEQIRNIFTALRYRKIVTVDKVRKAWLYKNWEVSVDQIAGLGDFVEIEYKGSEHPDPKEETDRMVEFLKSLGCRKIERNYLGYPFQLMFPDEVKWEEV